MNQPLISVVIPLFNAEKQLPKAIDSVLSQTHTNWEMIIVDDQSTDRSLDVAKEYAARDTRIKVLSGEKLGSPAKVRNVGLANANGEYITFLDSDDWFYDNALESLLGVLQKNTKLKAVHGFHKVFIDHKGKLSKIYGHVKLPKNEHTGLHSLPEGFGHSPDKVLTLQCSRFVTSFLYKKDLFKLTGEFPSEFKNGDDTLFSSMLFLKYPDMVETLPEYIYGYRLHNSSITKDPKRAEMTLINQIKVLDELFLRAAKLENCQNLDLDDLKSIALAKHYRGRCGCYYYFHEYEDIRKTVKAAWNDKRIKRTDLLKNLSILYVLSFLPKPLNQLLMNYKTYKANQ